MKYNLLDGINSPSDLKKLNKDQIVALASEIREFLIESTDKSGGHLASNLGVVELTLAIHTVFDSPSDHIVFDVGHQCYVHKMLTGRKDDFVNLRKPGGLSGFTLMRESEHDAFGAGHSSTSISAAIGYAESEILSGKSNHTVCVTGDGAFTGGMIHEALNNCRPELPLVIILNENGMSISPNKGAFASYLSRVRASEKYRKLKDSAKNIIDAIPLLGKPLHKLFSFAKKVIKKLVYKPNYFEELGLYYIGPVDGHNYGKICKALTTAKQTGKSCVVHIKTVKGKGYSPAEDSPEGYHSVTHKSPCHTFHSKFAEKLIELAEGDDKITAVTAAMGVGTGLSLFGEKYPNRYFDVGIAEPHALTFSAGLAAGGYKPFIAIYSTFLQRGYDNLVHDIALQNLPVKLMIDRAGLAKGDGATHHGIFDVSFISHIPGMTLMAPISYQSLQDMTSYAADFNGPVAIRYANASENTEMLSRFKTHSPEPTCRVLRDFDLDRKPEYIFITYGGLYTKVCGAADMLRAEGIDVGVIVVESLKPYTSIAKELLSLISSAKRVVYAEEGIRNGGAADITRDSLISLGFDISNTDYRIAAIDDNFASPEKLCDIYDYVGLSEEKLKDLMKN